MKKNLLKRDIELLFEIGSFRFIDRTWTQFLGKIVANNSEHTLRVMWISLLLAKHEQDIDYGKLLKMALIHDLGESRTGDANYITRQYIERKEEKAIADTFKDTSLEKEMGGLFSEYEQRSSIEAKIVKDADNLDVDLEIKELEANGNTLVKKWMQPREKGVYPKLHTKQAKKMWKEIQKSNSYDWHLHSPNNRIHAGDFKPVTNIKSKNQNKEKRTK